MSGAAAPELLPPVALDAGYDSAGKSADQIEADIVATRAELGGILDALERRLAPRHLLERGIDMMKDTLSGDGGGLGDRLRGHPVPLAVVGLGIGWLLMSSTARARLGEVGGAVRERVAGAAQGASELAGEVRDTVAGWGAGAGEPGHAERYPTESAGYAYARQKSGGAMDKARQAAAAAGGKLEDTLERGQETGRAAWEQAKTYAGGAGDRFGEMVQEHPLAVGALAVLAGAAVALLLPKSRIEERVAGGAGDALRERASDLGHEMAERTRYVGEHAVDAVVGAVKDAVDEVAGGNKGEAARATTESSVGSGEPGRV